MRFIQVSSEIVYLRTAVTLRHTTEAGIRSVPLCNVEYLIGIFKVNNATCSSYCKKTTQTIRGFIDPQIKPVPKLLMHYT